MLSHISFCHKLYRSGCTSLTSLHCELVASDFDGDVAGNGDGINFIIKRIHVWTSTSDDGYKFGTGSWR